MGGKKRKIPIEKVEMTNSRAVTHTKRLKGLYSKTSKLCLLSGAQIAIIATPVSSNSNVSFYSFGHSSVDSVVSAFLANQRPRYDDDNIGHKGLGFWWEDENLAESENSNELSDAIDSIARMLQNLKGLQQTKAVENHEGLKKEEDLVSHGSHQELYQNHQTLYLPSTSASICIAQDDSPADFEGLQQTKAVENHEGLKDLVSHGSHQELDQNHQTLNLPSTSASICIAQDDSPANCEGLQQTKALENHEGLKKKEDLVLQELDQNQTLDLQSTCASNCIDQDDSPAEFEGLVKISQGKNQIVEMSDNDNSNNNNSLLGNFDECDEEFDLDEIFDLLDNPEGLSTNSDVSTNQNPCSDSEVGEDGATMVIQGEYERSFCDSDEDKILASSNNNNALPRDLYGWNEELDLDQNSSFETNAERLMDDVSALKMDQSQFLDSEAVKDGPGVIHRDYDEDNLHFFEYFNELTSIAAL